jgi:uncharacterized protein YndB with AHSA1/START domain
MELHEDLGAVRREVILPVDRHQAWELISDPRELETWLADEVDIEMEPGAEGTVRFEDGTRRHACVEEVDTARRIVLCWWAHDEERTLVELTLDDVPEGTRLVVVELPVRVLHAVGTTISGAASWASGPQLAAVACA